MCIYIRNQIKILQRNEMCCQRGAAASCIFFFLNQSLHSSPVMSVMFADRAFRTVEKERASAFSFFSFVWIFLVHFQDILLGSLFSWCCFVSVSPDCSDVSCQLSQVQDSSQCSTFLPQSPLLILLCHSTAHHQGAALQLPPSSWRRWRGLQQQDLEGKCNSTVQLQILLHPQRALRINWSFASLPKTFKIILLSLVAVFKLCFFHLEINGPKASLS